jgi:pilus assembly protein Flp/PilA
MYDIRNAPRDLKGVLARFVSDEEGATAIEYALIGGLLSIAIVVSAIALGDGLSSVWNFISDEVTDGLNR